MRTYVVIVEMLGRQRFEELQRAADLDRLVLRAQRDASTPAWRRALTRLAGTAGAALATGTGRNASRTGGRMRGNIKEVERELGLSYPTVRARLDSLLAALGYAVEPDRREIGRRRREILDALDAGKISAEEALRMLRERK